MGGACCSRADVYHGPNDAEAILAHRRASRETRRSEEKEARNSRRGSRRGSRSNSTDGRGSVRGSVNGRGAPGRSRKPSVNVSGPYVEVACCSQGGKGDDWSSQDAWVSIPKVHGDPKTHFFGVFDGHGQLGKEVAEFVKKTFPTSFFADKNFPNNPAAAFKSAAQRTNKLLGSSGIDASLSGSTCCCCCIIGQVLYTCNIGDSRLILGTGEEDQCKAKQLTTDHSTKNLAEQQRIKAAGGRITRGRIYCADEDVPGLIPSRTMGDFAGKRAGIICDPQTGEQKLQSSSNFLALLSDGVWENVPASKLAVLVARNRHRVGDASRRLVNAAKKAIISGNKYKDDMTCLLVVLHDYGKFEARAESPDDIEPEEVYPEDEPGFTIGERVAWAIEQCEAYIDEDGVHVDDAVWGIQGLSPEERFQVVEFLSKHRGAQPPKPLPEVE